MKRIDYLNGIACFEEVSNGIDFSLVTYEKTNNFFGNEIYEASFNFGKNDNNLKIKTFFYKSIFTAVNDYCKNNLIEIKKDMWIKFENHLIQFPGNEDPQLNKRCADLNEGKYVMLYCLDTINDGGFITIPNQNFSIHLQQNSMLVFPTGKDYEYNIHKIGGNKERKFIEMVIG